VLVRNGPQVVVFENGLGAKLGNWDKVFPEISKNTTAFAYNRPGYGDSDPATTPRDGEHIVEELRALLKSKGLRPPYVLVGHSAPEAVIDAIRLVLKASEEEISLR
jgi:Predicted hydrolases or acyltransferases (alpha/beta hydrolase superfamily)